jgi:tubulin beta
LEKIKEEYPKKILMTISIFPSPLMSDAVVEPYNAVLAMDEMINYADENVIIDNQALYQIVTKKMGNTSPTYNDINQLVSQVMSDLTASLRFKGSMNTEMKEVITNLVPYPRSHFLMASLAPLTTLADRTFAKISTESLVQQIFDDQNILAAIDLTKGTFLACSLLFRGDNNPSEINKALLKIKNKIKFSSFIPTGIKYGFTSVASKDLKRSGSALINHTGVAEIMNRILSQFNLMFNKSAFLQWYEAEGMKKEDFENARANVTKLMDEYKRDEE